MNKNSILYSHADPDNCAENTKNMIFVLMKTKCKEIINKPNCGNTKMKIREKKKKYQV